MGKSFFRAGLRRWPSQAFRAADVEVDLRVADGVGEVVLPCWPLPLPLTKAFFELPLPLPLTKAFFELPLPLPLAKSTFELPLPLAKLALTLPKAKSFFE